MIAVINIIIIIIIIIIIVIIMLLLLILLVYRSSQGLVAGPRICGKTLVIIV